MTARLSRNLSRQILKLNSEAALYQREEPEELAESQEREMESRLVPAWALVVAAAV